jgi:hypothetical protein
MTKNPSAKVESPSNDPTLKTLGISKNQSSQWQQLAKIPEPKFEKRLALAQVRAETVTTKHLLRAPVTTVRTQPSSMSRTRPDEDCLSEVIQGSLFMARASARWTLFSASSRFRK